MSIETVNNVQEGGWGGWGGHRTHADIVPLPLIFPFTLTVDLCVFSSGGGSLLQIPHMHLLLI